MRLKSGIWVAAYIRRCQVEGAQAVLRRRGAEEAGAVFIKVSKLDGTADVYGPAPQSAFEEARPSDRAFIRSLKADGATEADAEARSNSTPTSGSSRSKIAPGAIFSIRWWREPVCHRSARRSGAVRLGRAYEIVPGDLGPCSR
jgi:hypothetical protein